jgi:hypothetical protein
VLFKCLSRHKKPCFKAAPHSRAMNGHLTGGGICLVNGWRNTYDGRKFLQAGTDAGIFAVNERRYSSAPIAAMRLAVVLIMYEVEFYF